jgi:hypothetical protein
LVTTSENAYLDITTSKAGGDKDAPTVNLGTSAVDWTIGKDLVVTAREANLILQGNITAQNVSIDAKMGSLVMVDGKTVTSDGTITLAGADGLDLSNVVGSTTDMTQQINLNSSGGNIRDLTTDELANIVTAGSLNLNGASIGTQGEGDIDLLVGKINVTTTSDNAGGATLESLSTGGTELASASTTGALSLTVNEGDLFVTGDAKVGGLILNLGAAITPLNTRNIVQTDGTTIESLGAATLVATGDIKLSQLSVLIGDATLNAHGRILDMNSAVDATTGKEVANIIMGTGALTAEALSIGTDATDGDIDLDVSNIASLVATDATSGQHITVTSYSSATLTELDAGGKATFVQMGGDLTLDGTIRVETLEMTVQDGGLSQSDAAKLFVTNDIDLATSGDMALSGITSLEGNVTLDAGGAILDNSVGRETAIITTAQDGKTVTLTAGSIGTSAFGGQIEVSTDHIASATANTGGIYLAGLKAVTVGPVNAANGAGNVSIGTNTGKLTLTGQVLANQATMFATTSDITMNAGAVVNTSAGAVLSAAGDLQITEITASETTSQTQLTAGGALIDGNAAEPNVGWNVDAHGLVELSADTIGTTSDAFDVRSDTLNSVTATQGTTLLVASQTGTVTLKEASVRDGDFTLNTADNLAISQSVRADALAIMAGGTIAQDEISKITTRGDLSLVAGGDITLGSLQTTDGIITLDASQSGYILDGTTNERANITGLSPDASLTLSGKGIGNRNMVSGENVGDIDIDIATIDSIDAGDGGIYLGSVRDLNLGPITSVGEMELDVEAGDLTLTGSQTVLRAKIDVQVGALTQLDGTVLTASGASGAGSITATATSDISISRMVANNGDVSVITTRGKIIDNSTADGAGEENIVINNGKLTALSATAIGNRYEQGALDVAATSVGDIAATDGGAFVAFTGVDGSKVTIDSVTADAKDADVGLTIGQGGLTVTSLSVARDLSINVAGNADVKSLELGNTTAGGTLSLAATAGDIAQISGTSIVADGSDALTTLSAGGDITLDSANNDFAALTVLTGADVTIKDRDDLDLHDVNTTGTFDICTGDQLVVLEGTNIDAGGDIKIIVANGLLDLEDDTTITAGNDISLTTNGGDFRSLGTVQITATGAIDTSIAGDTTFEDTTSITTGGDLNLSGAGDFKAAGTTTLTSTNGKVGVASTSKGDITLSGTTVLDAKGGITVSASDGDMALSDDSTLSSDTGTTALIATTGGLRLSGTSTIAGDDVSIALQSDFAISGQTSITANTGAIDATVAAGDVTLTGTTTLTAQTDLRLKVTDAGDIAMSGGSTITATTGDLEISQGTGDLSFKDSSTLTAGNDIAITVTDGDLKTSSATTLRSGKDITVDLQSGSATLIHRSIMDAGNTLTLKASDGVAGSGLTDLLGGQQVQLEINKGDGTFINTAKVLSGQGDVSLKIDIGSLSLRDETSVQAAKVVSITIGAGDVTLADDGKITAETDAFVEIGTGNLILIEDTTITAGEDLDVKIGSGLVELNDNTVLRARDTLNITVERGGVTMEDAETLITATDIIIRVLDGLTLDQYGDVRIDLIEALSSARIEALGGAILDNTASELIDNLVAPQLEFTASDGIGVEWGDNLNVNTLLLSALNTETGGINIQNRSGLTIAPTGVRNLAAGDVILIANGAISYQSSGYSLESTVEGNGIFTIPGQRLILLSNHGDPYFDANWGNTSRIQVLSVTSAASAADQSTFFGSSVSGISDLLSSIGLFDLGLFEYGNDVFDRFLDRFNFDEEELGEDLRPIRMAEYLLQNIEDSIALAQLAEAIEDANSETVEQVAQESLPEDEQPETESEIVTLLPDAVTLMSPDQEEALVIKAQAGDNSRVVEGLDRPVIIQAMLLADDEIDMPLIAAE